MLEHIHHFDEVGDDIVFDRSRLARWLSLVRSVFDV